MPERGSITDNRAAAAMGESLEPNSSSSRIATIIAKNEDRRDGETAPPASSSPPSSDRYAQLLEAVGDGVITIDSQHRVVEFNGEAARIFGYAANEILGQSINLLIPGKSRLNHDRHIDGFASEPTRRRPMHERADVRGRRKNGQEFDAEVSIAKIETDGELFFMAIARDVSGRKDLERALRDSKRHLEQAQQLTHLGSWEYDFVTGKLSWSPQIYKILGLDPATQEPDVALFQSLQYPEERAIMEARFESVLAKRETTLSADFRIIRPDGSERILHEFSELTWGEDGQLLHQVGTLQDVTEQRQTATQAQLDKESLQRAQELTKLGSWAFDPRADRMDWSDELYRLLGLVPGSITPSLSAFQSFIHPADLDHFRTPATDPLKRALTPGEAPLAPLEFRIRRADGAISWVYGRLQSILDPDGQRVVRVEGTVQDITERRMAADKLRQSEELLNRAQELANLGSWEFDEVTREISWSRNFFNILGLDPARDRPSDELFMSLVHPDAHTFITERYQKSVAERAQSATYNTRILRRDGQERMLRNIVEYFWSDDGSLLRINGTSQDVTDQLIVAEKLARSEHSLANAQRIAHIGNWDLNIETGAVWWSDEMYRIYGLAPAAPDPVNLLERIHPDDRERLETNIVATMRNERPYESTHRIVLPSGVVRVVHEQAEVVLSADGRPIEISGTVQDVTEAQQTTDELERNEWFLAQSQRIARMGSWEMNTLTGEMRWSSGFYSLSGLDPANQAPNTERFMALIHPDDRAAVADRSERLFAGDHEQLSGDYRMIRSDGVERIIHAEAGVVADKDGLPTRIIGTLHDVTEQEEAREALEAALALAQSADKAKSEFLANMSHELRTPLNAIIGFADILSLETLSPSLSARDRDYARDIRNSGLHLLDIINDVLDFSRLEAGRAAIRDEVIDTEALIDWVVKLLGPKAEAKDLQITISVAPLAAGFRGDLRLIRQALLNIVGNAIKFTISGGISLAAVQAPDGSFVLSVTDTGIGMRTEDIPAALTPFTQLENSLQRHYEGVGLGFPLAKRFVELHGGTFAVTSELLKGTTVTITLPAWRCEAIAPQRWPEI